MDKAQPSQMTAGAKSAYERSLLELLVRHELPRNADVRIDVAKGGNTASAHFSFRGDQVGVKSDVERLGLTRTVAPWCW